ncbi:Sec-independent protein translocase protein TatB [Cypionkella sp.]|jgi:sec-independent protein translocase protein TatB|uniref:Sec-independent protein translocase protein TatB n=1 Tax=Cypionkella sp. TaxID=2811411 RepID=UPI002FDCB39D
MFGDIGFAELLLIGIIALIVVGPEDLPQMFRQIGRFTAKIKSMGREFSRAMEQAAADTGIKDVAKDLKSATSAKGMGLDKVKEAADRFEKWDPIKNAAKPSGPARPLTPPPMPATPPAVTTQTILGPETQALMDKQAAKKAILAETSEKLKAVEAKPATAAADKPAPKPRAKKPVVAEAAAAKPPRAPRKTKKADEA